MLPWGKNSVYFPADVTFQWELCQWWQPSIQMMVKSLVIQRHLGVLTHNPPYLLLPPVPPQYTWLAFPVTPQQQEQHLQFQGAQQGRGLGERICRWRAQHGGGVRRAPGLPVQPLPKEQLQRLPWEEEQHGGLQRRGVTHRPGAGWTPSAWGENR